MQVVLVMFKANGQRKEFTLKKAVTHIGRGNECELRIPLGVVSRQHCQLSVSEAGLFLLDLDSSNGTLVNNRRVKETKVEAGDTITIGPVVFTVVIDGQPEQVKPVRTVIVESSVEPVQTASMEDSATIDVDLANDKEDDNDLGGGASSSGSYTPPAVPPQPKPRPQ